MLYSSPADAPTLKEWRSQRFWLAVIYICIALTIVLVPLIVQDLFAEIFDGYEIDKYRITEANRAYEHRFDPLFRGLKSITQNSKLYGVIEACKKHGLKDTCPIDLLAISYTESRFNPNAVSISNDKGYFQISPLWINGGYFKQEDFGNWNKESDFAAWLLKRNGYNENRFQAIGFYHSRTKKFYNAYLKKIKTALALLEK